MSPTPTEMLVACRVCLKPATAAGSRALGSSRRGLASLLDMLRQCFPHQSIHLNVGHPQTVCRRCAQQLTAAYKLKKTYEQTNRQLRAIITRLDAPAPELTAPVSPDTCERRGAGEQARNAEGPLESPDLNSEMVLKDDNALTNYNENKDGEVLEVEIVLKHERGVNSDEFSDKDEFSELENIPLANLVQEPPTRKVKENKPPRKIKGAASEARAQRCEVCGFATPERGAWRQHLRLHPYTRFLCSYCAKGFKNMFTLNVHMRSHTRDKPFRCGECGRGFTQKHSLRVHERALHRREKPFACRLCLARFPRKEALEIHVRARHTRERPYACAVCDARFNQPANLAKHLSTHTGEKRYACGQCAFRTAYSSALKKHERAHRGERSRACLVCGKSFADNSSLSRHRRIHTGELPYRCALCPRAFIDSWKRSQHLARAHPASDTRAGRAHRDQDGGEQSGFGETNLESDVDKKDAGQKYANSDLGQQLKHTAQKECNVYG